MRAPNSDYCLKIDPFVHNFTALGENLGCAVFRFFYLFK